MHLMGKKSPNSPVSNQPVALQIGKESAEPLKSLEHFNADILTLKNIGFNIRITEGLSIIMKVNIKSYMMDIAVAHYYLGLGGAYCYLCDFTKKNNV